MLSTLALLLRLVVSLAIVFGLMAACAALLRRSGMGGPSARRRGLPVEVLARHTLGRRASVAVIRAGGKGLVLGITDHTVTLLAEADPDDFELPTPPISPESSPRTGPTSSPWKALITSVQDRTARR